MSTSRSSCCHAPFHFVLKPNGVPRYCWCDKCSRPCGIAGDTGVGVGAALQAFDDALSSAGTDFQAPKSPTEQRDGACSPHPCGELLDLLIEAAEQIEEQIEVFARSYGIWHASGTWDFSPANRLEYERLKSLARKLWEAANG